MHLYKQLRQLPTLHITLLTGLLKSTIMLPNLHNCFAPKVERKMKETSDEELVQLRETVIVSLSCIFACLPLYLPL